MALTAKELRIGNYIHATHEIQINRGNGIIEDAETLLLLRVRGIDEDSQLIDGSCMFSLEEVETDYQLERYSNLEPIPLTEQCLIDFGFYKEGKTMLCLDLDEDNRICFPSANTDKNIYIECNQYDYNHMDNNYCVLLTAIKHVHQLQNLYFALTGKELKLRK